MAGGNILELRELNSMEMFFNNSHINLYTSIPKDIHRNHEKNELVKSILFLKLTKRRSTNLDHLTKR